MHSVFPDPLHTQQSFSALHDTGKTNRDPGMEKTRHSNPWATLFALPWTNAGLGTRACVVQRAMRQSNRRTLDRIARFLYEYPALITDCPPKDMLSKTPRCIQRPYLHAGSTAPRKLVLPLDTNISAP